MLASVVSCVRRRLRRQKSRHILVPPDLRRWSDFTNPFPHVSPGGYRRYYETHGMPEPRPPPAPTLTLTLPDPPPRLRRQRRKSTPEPSPPSSPVPSLSLSALPVPFPPDLYQQPPDSSPTSTTASSSSSFSRQRGAQKSTWTLSTILEASPAQSPTTSTRAPTLSLSHNSSLRRRRRRQLLRTPSVERDFPGCAPAITFSSSTDSSATSTSTSTSTSARCLYSVDTPSTTVEGLGLEEDRGSSLQKGDDSDDLDVDPYERCDSRSSYCTARSEFSDEEDD